MGIININKQQASQSTRMSPGVSRGLAMPMDGTKHTTPGAGYDALVPLDLAKYESLTKPSPRTTPKPAQKTAAKKATPWYIRLFESIRWTRSDPSFK